MSSPRSAPACSIAVRMSVSISLSRTISPETACDTLITVARSRCSTGAPIVLVGAGAGSSPELGMHLVELPHLALGAPAQIAVAGVPPIHAGDLLEAARRVEAGRKLMGERLVVEKTVGARRTDGLFVEAHRVDVAAVDAGDLRADKRCAVLEILRTILRPDLELPVVGGESLDGKPRSGRLPRSREDAASASARVEMDIPRFRAVRPRSTTAAPRFRRGRDRRASSPARKRAWSLRTQYRNSI